MKIYGVSAAIATVIAALVNFIFKAWIDHQLRRDLQRIQAESDQVLERVRNENAKSLQAQRILMERLSYKQTKAHDMRLDAIQTLMSCMANLELSLNPLVGLRRGTGIKEKDDAEWMRLVGEAAKAYNAFMEAMMHSSWSLPKETTLRLDVLRRAAFESLHDVEFAQGGAMGDPKFGMELFKKARLAISKEMPAVREQLEADFRSILAAE